MPVIQRPDGGWDPPGGWSVPRGGSPGYWYAPQAVIPEIGTLQIILSEGEIEGLDDGLKSVYLDGTPILASDGTTYNFKGFALALVAGTNTQPAISGITGTESETTVNVRVKNAMSVTRAVTSNPTAVRLRISVPSLKIVDAGTGAESPHSVTVKVERQNAAYTPSGGAAGDWEIVTLPAAGVISGGPYSTKLTTSYRVELPASGTWQIRVTRVSADDADVYHQSQTYWDAFTEIVDGAFRYPNTAVLSAQISAEQFQSIPQINVVAKGIKVLVPSNYEPPKWVQASGGTPAHWTAAVYHTTGFGTSGGVWDGTFGDWATSTIGKKVWTSNPAWIFLDAATITRYGAGSFLNVAGLDKWALYSISQWCDQMVSDLKGGTEPRFTCNLYIQNQQNAIKALGQLASVFWGSIYYASGLVVPLPDSNDAPVALFTNANVENGNFTYAGTARSARHSACVVSFIDPDLGWSQNTATYEDEAAIARYGFQVLDYQAIACGSYRQALDLGKWAILTETMCGEVVSFTSGLEGSGPSVAPGRVIQIADQFRAGNTRSGGRIISASNAAGNSTVVLDAPVTLGAGTYTLRCQTNAGMESKTVTTGAGTTSSLTVSGLFSSDPAPQTGWLLQQASVASLWRVLSVKKAEGIKFEITALKHDPAKYALI